MIAGGTTTLPARYANSAGIKLMQRPQGASCDCFLGMMSGIFRPMHCAFAKRQEGFSNVHACLVQGPSVDTRDRRAAVHHLRAGSGDRAVQGGHRRIVSGTERVSAGAGGHAGEISAFAFGAEPRQWFDGPIALSGAIGNGRAIRAARLLGADFAYIGSAFIATLEANAVEGYKQMITASTAEDIVYSNLFTGVHGNYLKPSIVAAGMDPENLPESDASKMSFGTDASGERAKPKAWKEIWGSGQGVGSVGKILPAAELIARFRKEYAEAVDPPL